MTIEKRYEFKKDLLQIHKPGLRDSKIAPNVDDFVFTDGTVILLPPMADATITQAARDFESFLYTSMGVAVTVSQNPIPGATTLKILLNQDIGEAAGYMGYRITIGQDSILLEGYHNRGVAQGLYFLEDLMGIRRAPYLKQEVIARKAIFEGRTSQSPFGMYQWNDEAFAHMAHLGMDTISLWIKDVNLDKFDSFLDINTLAERAEKYGIDVTFQLFAKHNVHPDDPGAEAFYENLYGPILDACPKLKGFGLIGEATEFSSKDPKAGLAPRLKNFVDNIPTGKCTPGWWPCYDYAEWVDLIHKVAKKHNPDIRVTLSTYNWGYAPEEDRIALIDRLPTDIQVQATWDMFEQRQMGNTVQDGVDYSLNFVGPGKYFVSEAEACKRRGIRLSTNAQSSGRTWDFGMVPYEPMPYQWMKRWSGMVEAAEKWDLKAVGENIHYGFHPSIMTELEKFMFFTPYQGATAEQWLLKLIARDFGEENITKVDKAFRCFSEAITHYPATNEDQYGGFRTGPSFPFWMQDPRVGLTPLPNGGRKPVTRPGAHQYYWAWYTPDIAGRNSLPGVRIYDEMALLSKVRALLQEGMDSLNNIETPSRNLEKLKALTVFMINSCTTVIHIKEFYIKLQQLSIIGDKEKADKLLKEIEELLLAERKNAEDTIPAVQADSRLGWEPMQDYLCDEEALRWKLRQIDYTLEFELPKFRKSNSL